ncbi:MAG: hypothetical protein RIF32_21405 [Leptospirales bacterium]|jgi:hypothetical protein
MSALFPGISTTLVRSEEEIQESLLDVRERLGRDRFEAYLQSLESLQASDDDPEGFGHWFLRQYCLFAGFLQADFVFDDSQSVFRFGAEVVPWQKLERRFDQRGELSDENEHDATRSGTTLPRELCAEGPGALVELSKVVRYRDHSLSVRLILPARLEDLARNLLDHEILPFARNLFFFSPGMGEARRIDHLAILNQQALAVLNERLEQGMQVTISHFKFQDLHIYLEMQGEHRTREILRGIIDYIHGNLKKQDLLLQLTPLSYIMISPGATQEQILERFRSIYFQIRSLVLEYQIHLTTVSETPVRLGEVWKDLKL